MVLEMETHVVQPIASQFKKWLSQQYSVVMKWTMLRQVL